MKNSNNLIAAKDLIPGKHYKFSAGFYIFSNANCIWEDIRQSTKSGDIFLCITVIDTCTIISSKRRLMLILTKNTLGWTYAEPNTSYYFSEIT